MPNGHRSNTEWLGRVPEEPRVAFEVKMPPYIQAVSPQSTDREMCSHLYSDALRGALTCIQIIHTASQVEQLRVGENDLPF